MSSIKYISENAEDEMITCSLCMQSDGMQSDGMQSDVGVGKPLQACKVMACESPITTL